MRKNESLIFYAVAYMTIFNYGLILTLIALSRTTFTDYTGLVLRFGIGAIISIFFSILIIRSHRYLKKDFTSTLIKLAIAHVPTVIGLVLSFMMFI
ncbi:hypothetical protein BK010_00680 [Tenericutes bacterium MO-XQ]|nr:hypothetical protein BK010_00680 [Tenericutes bacterium MO-XQ]